MYFSVIIMVAVRNLWVTLLNSLVSDVAIFVLKRDVKLQLTNCWIHWQNIVVMIRLTTV